MYNSVDPGKLFRLWMTTFGEKQSNDNLTIDEIKTKLDVVIKFYEFTNKCTVSEEEYNQTLRALYTRLSIKGMGKGGPVIDPKTYRPWLKDRNDIKPYFWNRYRTYLIETKCWNRQVVDSLGNVTNDILDLIGNPADNNQWKLRGLVMGDVQSGKTANFTALCNKAMDAGYRVIIILAGSQENLRHQTQKRLDKELVGFDSQELLDKIVHKIPIGVGDIEAECFVTTFTSKDFDFDKKIQGSVALRLKDINGPALFVIKKQKQRLDYLIKWLKKHNSNADGMIDEPMLLIDDEADNASVNVRDGDPTTINKSIRKLLASFSRRSYVGYTATPYANIFIDPDTDDQVLDKDLFPSDFIYPLRTPSNYIGNVAIFGDEAVYESMLIKIDDDEAEDFIPLKHKGVDDINGFPESLYDALRYFLLINAAMDTGEGKIKTSHRSMLINISRLTNVHGHILYIVHDWLEKMKSEILSYSALEPEEALKIQSMLVLKLIWDKHKMNEICGIDWKTLQQKYLYNAVSKIDTVQVNQNNKASNLDYDKFSDTGLRVIAIGGISLSRGLTLEGLCVSYFYRNSHMYDTLLQMGRWFGYRDGYEKLCKIWMSDEAIESYCHITQATVELREELQYMHNNEMTPREFGLMIRSKPEVVDLIERERVKRRIKYNLTVTAKNKMKSATEYVRVISISGDMIETPKIPNIESKIINNYKHTSAFISTIKEYKNVNKEIYEGKHQLFVNVPVSKIADLIRTFSADPLSSKFQPDSLADFIEQEEELSFWDVAIPEGSEKDGKWRGMESVFDLNFKPEYRYVDVDKQNRCLRVNGAKQRVGSKPCTRYGLKLKSIEEIEKAVNERKQSDEENGISDKTFLIQGRKPLLLIHFICMHCDSTNTKIIEDKKYEENKVIIAAVQEKLHENDACLVALGVGIPHNKDGSGSKKVRYIINKVKQQQIQEEIEEQNNNDD